jgi:hypothetical protein
MASAKKTSVPRLVVIGSYNTDLIIWCDRIPNRGEMLKGGDSEMFVEAKEQIVRWPPPEPGARSCSSGHVARTRLGKWR